MPSSNGVLAAVQHGPRRNLAVPVPNLRAQLLVRKVPALHRVALIAVLDLEDLALLLMVHILWVLTLISLPSVSI